MTPTDLSPTVAPFVNQCCVCGRQRVDDAWVVPNESAPHQGGAPERISHTYCPECLISAPPQGEATGRAFALNSRHAYDPAKRSAPLR